MIAHLLRRIGSSVLVLLLISLLIFFLLHLVYPSPARDVMGLQARQVQVIAWNKANGFDDPWIVQYLRWAGHAVRGDLGYSYADNQTVLALFRERAAASAYLSGVSLLLAVLIGIPLGIYQAVRRNSAGDSILTSLAFVFYSMPSYLVGLLLIQVFALSWHIFPSSISASSYSLVSIMTDWRSTALPIITQTLVIVALFARYMRSSALEVLAQDYIKVARAKGLPERLVLTRHLLRNACLPMVTLLGLSLPAVLAGNLIVEELFNFQGLGYLFFISLGKGDYPVLLAYTLVGAVLVVAGNFVADIALSAADPRVRLTG